MVDSVHAIKKFITLYSKNFKCPLCFWYFEKYYHYTSFTVFSKTIYISRVQSFGKEKQ